MHKKVNKSTIWVELPERRNHVVSNIIEFSDANHNFHLLLLQFSESYDPSEIILIYWFITRVVNRFAEYFLEPATFCSGVFYVYEANQKSIDNKSKYWNDFWKIMWHWRLA